MKEQDFLKKAVDEGFINKEEIRTAACRRQKKGRRFSMKKAWVAAITIALIAVIGLTAMTAIYFPQKDKGISPRTVSSYGEVLSAIEGFRKLQNTFDIQNTLNGMLSSPKSGTSSEFADDGSSGGDYSRTNVQTEGMDEGDIVKNDGNYIYKISTEGCFIIEAQNGGLEIKSVIAVENYVPLELYVRGDSLIMVGGLHERAEFRYGNVPWPMMDCFNYIPYTKTDIRVYDISNKAAPSLIRRITVDGNYFTSRIKEADGKLYYVINYSFNYGNEDRYIPYILDTAKGGDAVKFPADSIFVYNDICSYSYLIIGEIALDAPDEDSAVAAYLGLGGQIYASADNIYVATHDENSVYRRNIFGWVKRPTDYLSRTRLVRISLSSLKQEASGRIDGTVKDRYSLDEHNGFLRVATTVFGSEQYSNLYVMASDLSVVGKVESIAKGESIYSVRFNGDRCYLVTFQQIDPYFIFDLSDPYHPFITGELKEDGVSYYIHNIEDTDFTVGIGLMTRTETYNGMDVVIWTGLKVSLYDNSGAQAVNVKTITIDGSCHAELFYNPKALLYNKDRGLIAFAYENWRYDDYYSYSSMTQGLAVFGFDLTQPDDAKLVYKGTLTNLESDASAAEWNAYYDRYLTFITRGIQIGDYIYTVSDKCIASYDIESLNLANRIYLLAPND